MLLRKAVYPYNYMDSCERFNETKLPDKKSFYNKLNQEDIINKDQKHGRNVWKTYGMQYMGEYHDLYVQSDTIMLTDIFENFRNNCMKIYELDPAHFLSAPGLTWEACLKQTKIKLELSTDKNMLLMFEEGTRGEMCQAIYHYATANKKHMKNCIKDITSSYLEYLDANNLYGWAMCKNLPVGKFKW